MVPLVPLFKTSQGHFKPFNQNTQEKECIEERTERFENDAEVRGVLLKDAMVLFAHLYHLEMKMRGAIGI